MTVTPITSLWPDGSILTADTYPLLESELRSMQWSRYSVRAFRREMRRRARLFAGADARVDLSSARAMFESLESLGLIRLETGEDDDAASNG